LFSAVKGLAPRVDSGRERGYQFRVKPKRTSLRLDAYLPYRLSVAANEVSRLVARAYEDRFGLTIPQWRMIAHMAEHGPTTPQQLGRLAAMDKVTVSRASRGLLSRGLAKRVENGEDGRSHILALTEDGSALYETIAPLALAFERALIDDWSTEDVERLHAQLKALQQKAAVLAGLS
jgi:DNA-binding MarR family transcriptional regulator